MTNSFDKKLIDLTTELARDMKNYETDINNAIQRAIEYENKDRETLKCENKEFIKFISYNRR